MTELQLLGMLVGLVPTATVPLFVLLYVWAVSGRRCYWNRKRREP